MIDVVEIGRDWMDGWMDGERERQRDWIEFVCACACVEGLRDTNDDDIDDDDNR